MPPRPPITVVLTRFDDLLGKGLREVIESDPSLCIVAADVEHRRLPLVLRAHRPDVAILDLGALAKLAEVRELSGRHSATRLIMVARDPSKEACALLLAFGASACLGSDTQSRDVLTAIHLASRGLQVVPRAGSDRVADRSGGDLLTQREAEVLPLLQQGLSNAEIGVTLRVGIETVRTHARNIYRKLGVSSRRELAVPRVSDPQRQTRSAQPPRRRGTIPSTRTRRGHGLRHT
jgi:DNA-binding NarL/FixJ family response regulator